MPELIRSIANRLREYVGDRRRATRHRVRLAVVVSLLEERAGAPPTVAGHTQDVSLSGLAVVLPSIRIGERYLAGEGQTLRLTLKLPNATARLYGTPVRYERLEGEGPDRGYLVGVRLTDAEEGRAALAAYIKTLKP
jgi:hypothetical protein